MAAVECKNDYTLALGKLLEYYQTDAKVQLLYQELIHLQERVAKVEQALTEPEAVPEDDGDAF